MYLTISSTNVCDSLLNMECPAPTGCLPDVSSSNECAAEPYLELAESFGTCCSQALSGIRGILQYDVAL